MGAFLSGAGGDCAVAAMDVDAAQYWIVRFAAAGDACMLDRMDPAGVTALLANAVLQDAKLLPQSTACVLSRPTDCCWRPVPNTVQQRGAMHSVSRARSRPGRPVDPVEAGRGADGPPAVCQRRRPHHRALALAMHRAQPNRMGPVAEAARAGRT